MEDFVTQRLRTDGGQVMERRQEDRRRLTKDQMLIWSGFA